MGSFLWDGSKDVPYAAKTDRYLLINSCSVDHYNLQNEDEFVLDRVRDDWYLMYFTGGSASAIVDGETIMVGEGDILLYAPGQRQAVTRRKCDKPASYYVHFTGYAVKDMLAECGLDHSGYYKTGANLMIEETFSQLVAAHTSLRPASYTNYLFFKLLMHIGNALCEAEQKNAKNCKAPGKIMNGLTRLDFDGINRQSKIEYYASISNYGSSLFAKRFKEVMGSTPKQHIMKKRIDKAKELLLSTSVSVTDIATQIGYKDPLYFSRIFKKYTGLSPSAYREKSQSEQDTNRDS